ncbi:heme oxygenase family protein [Methyloversatilis sp. RAC08]|uniref:biliverdin-producing heme oxygenase n=1 Tax=Methyloversatilis sp. RAC08 TaxID=1842540 RepID=UPI00083D899E|nr:biliverdin-producing heme oxygenase [Methyloversatilis sp. RAC08]AOF82529.1 heme oxygenase family protein [Methyloversatilis sp. RAC08]
MHGASITAGLAARLRTETAPLHRHAERSGLMARLLQGRIETRAYCSLLRSLHLIYDALESGLALHAGRPDIAPLCLPELPRTAALHDDLCALHGSSWSDDILPTKAAIEYAARLKALSVEQPALLASHSYVRHLGDLHGGQVLGRVVSGALQLQDGRGTRFYAFDGEVGSLIRRYRDGLDTLPQDAARIDALVAEAQSGFRRHIAMFDELAAAMPG